MEGHHDWGRVKAAALRGGESVLPSDASVSGPGCERAASRPGDSG